VFVFAQNKTITGKVTDEQGTPLSDVSIVVKGTSIGTVTSASGNYSLSVPDNAKTLVFSAVSYVSQEVNIRSQSIISPSLKLSDNSLEAVVVVGYSSTTKEAFTGSAKVVSGEKINNKDVSNVSQALAGEVAGVRVINTSGQPGTAATIRIRGIGSVNGNRDPLYVIDGVPYSGTLNSLNPSDVASVTVLKDAAATSIYGSRGANGVVVITTRTGKGKKSFIEVDGKYGVNKSIIPRYDVISSPEEYIALSWEGLYNQGVKVGNADPVAYANARLFSSSGISKNNNIWNVTSGADLIDPVTRTVKAGVTRKFDPERWEDFAFQPSNRSEVNIKMGGGDSKTNYYTSFGYLEDNGYSIKTDFKRFNARLNLNHEVKSWLTTSFNLNYANTATNNSGQGSSSNSVFWFVDNIPSIYPLFLRDSNGAKVPDPIFGGFQYDYGATGRKFGSLTNSIADAKYNTSLARKNELTGNTSITVKFTRSLSLENRLGVQYYNNDDYDRSNKFYGSAASQNGSIFQSRTQLLNLNLLNMLRYAQVFNGHNIEVLAAHEATDFKQTLSSASGYNLVENNNLELANAIVINPTSTSYAFTNKLESYFAQLNYNYDRTYYLSGTVRRDGSSRFIKGNTWGTFGSVGLGWELTKMDFMKSVGAIDYLKLKASYGVLGDQEGLGYYPGYDEISIGNLDDKPSFGVPVPGNAELTWETSKMFQTGVEFRLGTYLTGAVDYYVKNTDNLIFQRRVGPSNGYALITVNDGQLRNQGIEFDLTAHLINKKDFYLDLGVNGEHFTNTITTMPIDPSTGKEKAIDVQSPYGWAKGHSIYDFYIRNFAGVDPTDGTSTWTVYYDDINNDKTYNAGEEVKDLEDYYSKNPDKVGTLQTDVTKTYQNATQYFIGKSALPKVRGAFNLNAGFKGLELNVQLLYSLGGYAYDGAYAVLMGNGLVGGNNWSTDIRNRWQKPGDVTDVPRISNNADANVNSTSSRFITKANYWALNNVRLGYSLPQSILSSQNFAEEITLFVSGDNLWLHSARNGFNPSTAENGSSDMYRYSPLTTVTGGIKVKF
jgi:TonB-linked SusC/RagA family outer membrane protein